MSRVNVAAAEVAPGQRVAANMSAPLREVFVSIPTWDGQVEVHFASGSPLTVAPDAMLKMDQPRDGEGRFVDDDS